MNISLLAILFCLLIGSGKAFSQQNSYSISPKTIDVKWDYTEDLDMRAFISSNSILNQDIEYTVITLDIPAQWLEHVITQFCDIQSCYDFRWFKLGDKKEMKLPTGSKNAIMKVDFLLPMDSSITIQPGSAEIALGFNLKGEPMNDTLRFMVNRSATGIAKLEDNSKPIVKAFANQHVSITHAEGIAKVFIYDLQGNLIEQHACGNSQLAILSLEHVSRGAYGIRVVTPNGREYSTIHMQ
ncbi:MAG: hypothetical protein ACK5DT_02320 [Ignavibacteria bacterium]|jgi:YD repeat-containing protein